MTIIHHNYNRVRYGILFFIVFFFFGIWFLLTPDIFIRNFVMKKIHIQILGVVVLLFSLINIYSFTWIFLSKKPALIIRKDCLIDRIKYESIGEICFRDITGVKKNNKNTIKVVMNKPVYKSRRLDVLQKILLISNNWNYNDSIIISSALLECDIETLEKSILHHFNTYKKSNPHSR